MSRPPASASSRAGARAASFGIVFQFFQLLPTLTALENVVMPMDFARVHSPPDRRDKAMSLLERFDVADQASKTPDLLSGGQQLRGLRRSHR